jgi:hypothetical protein
MNLIIYLSEGRVFVVQPLITIQETIARLPEGTQYQILDSESLPPPETRDRWVLTENGIEIGEPPAPPPNWEGFILGFADCLGCFAAVVPNQDARTLIVAAINNASQNPQHAATHLAQAQAYWNRFSVAEAGAIASLNNLCQANHMPFSLDDDGKLSLI